MCRIKEWKQVRDGLASADRISRKRVTRKIRKVAAEGRMAFKVAALGRLNWRDNYWKTFRELFGSPNGASRERTKSSNPESDARLALQVAEDYAKLTKPERVGSWSAESLRDEPAIPLAKWEVKAETSPRQVGGWPGWDHL